MKKLSLFLIVCSALVFTGCPGTDECEEIITHEWNLPKVLNQYFPYEVGQQVAFYNDKPEPFADTLVYEVREVFLLNYDSAYYTSLHNPCYPEDTLPLYGVLLTKISEQSNDNTPRLIRLNFGGTAGGANGQEVDIRFSCFAQYNGQEVLGWQKYYKGEISDLGDVINLNTAYNNYSDHMSAQIIKGKGLTIFDNRGNGYINWPWYLVE